jgi:site-specific recombinase XerD
MVNSEISKLIEDFLTYHRVDKNHSKETLRAYSYELNYLFTILEDNILGKKKYKIEQIKVSDVRNLLRILKDDKKNTPKTVSRKISVLKSFYRYIEMYVSSTKKPIENIMNKIESPKLPKKVREYPKEKDWKAFLENLNKRKYRNDFEKLTFKVFFLLKFYSMARTIEMIRIQVKDINFEEQIIILKGKGNKERPVPLNESTCKLIIKYIEIAELKRTDKLIRNKDNKPISKRALEYRNEKLLKEAGLPEWMTLHKLFRRTPATLLNKKGKAIGIFFEDLQEILGHEDPKTTKLYVESDIEEICAKIKYNHPLGN